VQDFLANQQVLLVLDNFEHVLEAGAGISNLLRAAPNIKILITSRTPLNIYGEQEYLVPPLALPDPKQDVDDLLDYEALRLFMARAQAAQPSFTPTTHQARVIAEICTRLDGLPLAIELAAARVKLFGPDGLLRRLQQPLAVLTDGARDLPARQRTLRHAISWSYDLLAPPEQRLFRQLSVFVGGWNVEAVTAVCASGEDETLMLDSIEKLLDSSLLRQELGPDGEARFGMLETIREYAHEQLIASAELDEMRCKHARYFQHISETAVEGLNGPQQVQWLDRLEVEHDNVRAALNWALETDNVELALRVAAPLWLFWLMRGHAAEGGQWLGRVVTASQGATVERAQALNGAGWIALFRGDYDGAEAHVEQSLSLFRELDDTEGIAAALANLGFVAMLGQRGLERVPAILQEVTSLQEAVLDKRTQANIFILQGLAAGGAQDWAASLALHEQSLELYQQIRDDQGIGMCLINISLLAMISGDIDKARVVMRENLRRSAAVDDKMPLQYALFGLGSVAARERRFERAATLWGAAEAVREAFSLQLTTMATSLTNYEADLRQAQGILGQERFRTAWDAGRTMPLIALLDYALE
jgi:predicted ATPase